MRKILLTPMFFKKIFFLFVLFCSPLLFANTPEHTVLLFSFDGTGAHALTKKNAPHFFALEQQGWHGSITPIFPSETFPNHTTMLTGVTAEEHGIVSNKFIDPTRGPFAFKMDPSWIEAEPLWVTLEKKKIPTAIVLWPLHGLGNWNGWHPAFETKLSKTEDIHEIIHRNDQKKCDTILKLLELPEKQRPHFIAAWFVDIDTAGHANGPGSLAVHKAIKNYDAMLGDFLKKFQKLPQSKNCDLIIVSDHGMACVTRSLSVPYLEQQLHYFGPVKIIESGTNARLYCSSRTAVRIFPVLKKLAEQTGAFDVYPGNEIPSAWSDHHPRNGAVFLMAHPHYYFDSKISPTKPFLNAVQHPIGKHGYPPSLPSMQALFIAAGPDFPHQKKSVHFEMTQIAPLILKILGVKK